MTVVQAFGDHTILHSPHELTKLQMVPYRGRILMCLEQISNWFVILLVRESTHKRSDGCILATQFYGIVCKHVCGDSLLLRFKLNNVAFSVCEALQVVLGETVYTMTMSMMRVLVSVAAAMGRLTQAQTMS